MLARLFTDHPRSIGENYFEHMCSAGSFAGHLFAASIVCFIHALIPGTFTKTGSRMVTRLYDKMVSNRVKSTSTQHSGSRNTEAYDFVI